MSRWQEMKLGEFVTLQRGHDLPMQSRKPGSIPIMGSFGVTGHHDMSRAPGPGVTIGRSGASFGVVSYSSEPFWPLNTALYVVDFHGNDERFAYYFLQQFDFTRYNSGSAQPSLNRNFIHPIPVRVPPLGEQRRIAHILGTLDDKIELNRRMNQTLEEIARAIFKSWFVDFDPVHAKAEGREPVGMDPETVALFPGSFQDSPLGKVPKGWEVGCLGDIASRRHQTVKPEDIEDGTPYVALDDVPRRSIALYQWKLAKGIASAKSHFLEGNVLFGKLRPYFHKVVVAPMDGICSTDIIVVSAADEALSTYVLMTCSSVDFVAYNSAVMTGTRMPRTNWKEMSSYELLVPPREIAAAYQAATQPLIDQLLCGIQEVPRLADVRDAILPQILSGSFNLGPLAGVPYGD